MSAGCRHFFGKTRTIGFIIASTKVVCSPHAVTWALISQVVSHHFCRVNPQKHSINIWNFRGLAFRNWQDYPTKFTNRVRYPTSKSLSKKTTPHTGPPHWESEVISTQQTHFRLGISITGTSWSTIISKQSHTQKTSQLQIIAASTR